MSAQARLIPLTRLVRRVVTEWVYFVRVGDEMLVSLFEWATKCFSARARLRCWFEPTIFDTVIFQYQPSQTTSQINSVTLLFIPSSFDNNGLRDTLPGLSSKITAPKKYLGSHQTMCLEVIAAVAAVAAVVIGVIQIGLGIYALVLQRRQQPRQPRQSQQPQQPRQRLQRRQRRTRTE